MAGEYAADENGICSGTPALTAGRGNKFHNIWQPIIWLPKFTFSCKAEGLKSEVQCILSCRMH